MISYSFPKACPGLRRQTVLKHNHFKHFLNFYSCINWIMHLFLFHHILLGNVLIFAHSFQLERTLILNILWKTIIIIHEITTTLKKSSCCLDINIFLIYIHSVKHSNDSSLFTKNFDLHIQFVYNITVLCYVTATLCDWTEHWSSLSGLLLKFDLQAGFM